MNKKQLIQDFKEKFQFDLVNRFDDEKIYGEEDQRENIERWLESSFDAIREDAITEIRESMPLPLLIIGNEDSGTIRYRQGFNDACQRVFEKLKEKERRDL